MRKRRGRRGDIAKKDILVVKTRKVAKIGGMKKIQSTKNDIKSHKSERIAMYFKFISAKAINVSTNSMRIALIYLTFKINSYVDVESIE